MSLTEESPCSCGIRMGKPWAPSLLSKGGGLPWPRTSSQFSSQGPHLGRRISMPGRGVGWKEGPVYSKVKPSFFCRAHFS